MMNSVQTIEQPAVHANPLVRKLNQLASLSDDDIGYLEEIQSKPSRVRAGVRLVERGKDIPTTFIVKSGWIMQYVELDDGRRQILGFALPGDVVGNTPRAERPSLVTIETVTRSELSTIKNFSAHELAASHPRLSAALYEGLGKDVLHLSSQVLRLGRLTAHERVCHLICELWQRNKVVGQVDDNAMPFPLTQNLIADALGLSLVHVNRQFGKLRRAGIITLKKKRLTIHKIDALRSIAHAKSVTLSD